MQSAWKVGLFVVAFGVMVFFAYAFVGNRLVQAPMDTYYAVFDDMGAVQPGAIVTMVGVKVGTVTDVRLASPKQAKMTLAVDRGTFVPADAVLSVPSNLFSIGEQRLELSSKRGLEAGRLPPGSTLHGSKASFLSGVLPDGETTVRELNETLKATRELLGDPRIKNRLVAVLEATEKSVNSLNQLMGDARQLIAQNQGTLRSAITNAAAAVEDMRRGIQSVTKQVSAIRLSEGANEILLALRNTAQQAEDLVSQLAEFVGDPGVKSAMANATANLETITRTGIDIAENTKAMTSDGKLITSKAVDLADTAKEIASQAKDLLARLNQLVDRLPAGVKVSQPSFNLETGRNTETNRFQTDVSVDYPLNGTSGVLAGVYDATETNKLTLQLSQRGSVGSLRYGVYASKPGIGVDFRPTSRFSLTGDLFDPNNLTFNLRARYKLGGDFFGYFGLNKMFDRNEPVIGVGIRR
jgi:phospholipid/cholesterol/gamma-HCH transport system substrate-binding protein